MYTLMMANTGNYVFRPFMVAIIKLYKYEYPYMYNLMMATMKGRNT
jgi:hypothetical protein